MYSPPPNLHHQYHSENSHNQPHDRRWHCRRSGGTRRAQPFVGQGATYRCESAVILLTLRERFAEDLADLLRQLGQCGDL